MSLTAILTEQEHFNFTGRVNILDKKSAQFLGVILQEEGMIVNARFQAHRGKKALFMIALDDFENPKRYRFVVEPEIIEDADRSFSLAIKDYTEKAQELIEKAQQSRKLRPPLDLRLALVGDFLIKGEQVDANEFSLMTTISDYSKVEDIYQYSPLFEFEITNALVSLRRKKALKVIAK